MTDNTFTCALCGGTFDKGESDEEAENELRETFGVDFSPDNCEVICDDCYQIVKPSVNPELFFHFLMGWGS